MFLALLPPVLPAPATLENEPDGSRSVGLPPFKAAPGAPGWLRTVSHGLAAVDCRHYMYEVYAFEGQYLVRYVMLPEGQEAFREIEQVFLYGSDAARKPKALKADEFQFNAQSALWKGKAWLLVDRRDLEKP